MVEAPPERHEVTTNNIRQLTVLWASASDKQAGDLYQDTGCNRCVGGPTFHKHMQVYLAMRGLKVLRVDKREEFVFGNTDSEMSYCAFTYPCFLGGEFVASVDIARIPPDCPGLYSNRMMKEWQHVLYCGKQTTYIGKFKKSYPFKHGISMFNILQTPTDMDLNKAPACFHLGHTTHHVTLISPPSSCTPTLPDTSPATLRDEESE